MAKNWILLHEYPSTVEADLAAARLRDAGLHVLTNSPITGVFGPGFSGQVAQGVRLLVPAEELHQARHALDLTDD
jgi:alpha-D-ribose 1-methylphosphonate 5-triphosphate diphosphatase PhnM